MCWCDALDVSRPLPPTLRNQMLRAAACCPVVLKVYPNWTCRGPIPGMYYQHPGVLESTPVLAVLTPGMTLLRTSWLPHNGLLEHLRNLRQSQMPDEPLHDQRRHVLRDTSIFTLDTSSFCQWWGGLIHLSFTHFVSTHSCVFHRRSSP